MPNVTEIKGILNIVLISAKKSYRFSGIAGTISIANQLLTLQATFCRRGVEKRFEQNLREHALLSFQCSRDFF